MSNLTEAFANLGKELNGTAGALGKLPDVLDQIAEKQKKAADAAAALNMALSIQKDAAAKAQQELKDVAAAAQTATDAFGTLAGGLTAVSAAADHATDGLQGVAWSMVHATKPTIELNDAQNKLIESLAKVADAGGASDLWIGHLIAQLKDGTIGFDEFQKEVNSTLRGLTVFGDVMGNTAVELNALNTILSDFKNKAKEGWP